MANDPFITDFDPAIGVAEILRPGLRRIVAPNASAMTFRGTNTYLLGHRNLAVIDPGPDDPAHLEAILAALRSDQKISHIFVTHSHVDHSPLAQRLALRTKAPVLALGDSFAGRSQAMEQLAASNLVGGGEGVDHDFAPDICLTDGQVIDGDGWSLQAITTPGHFSNHMCFAWEHEDAVFSGDHIMSWATTMVSPPDGDLSAFMASLDKMALRKSDAIYFPGHGAPVEDPQGMIRYLITHRRQREAQILQHLNHGPQSPAMLAKAIYTEIPTALLPAATRNVLAHLLDLQQKNVVKVIGSLGTNALFTLR